MTEVPGPLAQRSLTVGEVVRYYATTPDANRPVLLADDGARTWSTLAERSARVANALRGLGLAPGAKVATLLPNCGEYVEIMYGIALAGCVIVPLNSRSVAREVEFAVEFSDAELLITAPAFEAAVTKVLPSLARIDEKRTWVVGEASFATPYEEVLAAASSALPDPDVSEGDLYWMPFTSGTTGVPKAAMVSHRALVDHWGIVSREFSVGRDDTMLIAGPFYHSLGFLFGLTGLFAGGRVVIHAQFEPERVLETIERERVTLTPMVPTMYTMVLAAAQERRYDVSSMRAVISAGSPLLTGTKNQLLDLFPAAGLFEFYGSTEIGLASILRPEDQRRKTRCVGLPVLGGRLRLVDDDGNPVAPGEAGEIQKQGFLLGGAYYKNPEATAAMYQDGWASSGDVGRFDDEGFLYIVDRKKDMIVTGGANVFPAEIEEVVSMHPGVLEVAVIGIPDETWGEAIMAVVVPQPGADLTTDDIVAVCEENLAGYKKPRRVQLVTELPKSGAGKVLRRELREQYWGDDQARVR